MSRALPESARTHSSQQFHTLLFVSPVPCAQHAGFAGGDSWEAYLENRRAVAALWHLAVFTHCFSCSHNAYQCFTWEREKIRTIRRKVVTPFRKQIIMEMVISQETPSHGKKIYGNLTAARHAPSKKVQITRLKNHASSLERLA